MRESVLSLAPRATREALLHGHSELQPVDLVLAALASGGLLARVGAEHGFTHHGLRRAWGEYAGVDSDFAFQHPEVYLNRRLPAMLQSDKTGAVVTDQDLSWAPHIDAALFVAATHHDEIRDVCEQMGVDPRELVRALDEQWSERGAFPDRRPGEYGVRVFFPAEANRVFEVCRDPRLWRALTGRAGAVEGQYTWSQLSPGQGARGWQLRPAGGSTPLSGVWQMRIVEDTHRHGVTVDLVRGWATPSPLGTAWGELMTRAALRTIPLRVPVWVVYDLLARR